MKSGMDVMPPEVVINSYFNSRTIGVNPALLNTGP